MNITPNCSDVSLAREPPITTSLKRQSKNFYNVFLPTDHPIFVNKIGELPDGNGRLPIDESPDFRLWAFGDN
jgi:hypothetical protein